jgi:hypothetical protein
MDDDFSIFKYSNIQTRQRGRLIAKEYRKCAGPNSKFESSNDDAKPPYMRFKFEQQKDAARMMHSHCSPLSLIHIMYI